MKTSLFLRIPWMQEITPSENVSFLCTCPFLKDTFLKDFSFPYPLSKTSFSLDREENWTFKNNNSKNNPICRSYKSAVNLRIYLFCVSSRRYAELKLNFNKSFFLIRIREGKVRDKWSITYCNSISGMELLF